MIDFNRSREIFLKIYPSERLANKIEYYIGRHEAKVKFFLLFCNKNRWEITLKQKPMMKLSLIYAFLPTVWDRYKEKNIDDILNMSVEDAISFFGAQNDPVAKRIAERLQPLVDVGLSYIKLGQSSSTLSGGESQRVKLAYFLSMSNDNVSKSKPQRILFIFDEPTTGLHFYDVEKLLKSFDALLAKGHTIVVVEHNLDVIRAADWVVDLGPEAGDDGGNLVFEGTPEDLLKCDGSFTAQYLR